MNTTTQQLPSNPALDFANAVLAETDGGREIVFMLHDIAQGVRENATTNDRINASNILIDGGLGKCPKKAPATTSPNPNPAPAPSPEPAEEGRGACPEPRRRVTQLGDSLNRSFGPPPSAPQPTRHSRESGNPQSHSISHSLEQENPESFDPYSIQKHILEITNNCLTLMTVLTDIYRAPDDDPKVKDSHRVRAGRMLVDRVTAMYPNAVLSAADGLVLTGDYPEHKISIQKDDEDEPFDEEVWKEIIAELKKKEEQGILTPDPNAPKIDYSYYLPPDDFDLTPYLDEEDAKFRAGIALRAERRKQWPEIEERRRKKLAQIYPSHSDDGGEQPET